MCVLPADICSRNKCTIHSVDIVIAINGWLLIAELKSRRMIGASALLSCCMKVVQESPNVPFYLVAKHRFDSLALGQRYLMKLY